MESYLTKDNFSKAHRGRETKMTKAELVAAMAEQAGLTKEQAKKALDAFTDSVTNS